MRNFNRFYFILGLSMQLTFAKESGYWPLKESNNNPSCGARCMRPSMPSPEEDKNKLVANPNGPVNWMMPGQCMGNTLMHQMLLSGAVFQSGPHMSPDEVKEKLNKLKSGEAQVFTGVSNIAELSDQYSPVLREFANKIQMQTFYSLNGLGNSIKVLSNTIQGNGEDLDKMAKQTDKGQRPAMIINPPGETFKAHVVLVDKIIQTGDHYNVSYVDSNTPNQNSSMTCDLKGQCQTTLYGTTNVRALAGSQEKKSFKMLTQKCCLQSSPRPGQEHEPDPSVPYSNDHYS